MQRSNLSRLFKFSRFKLYFNSIVIIMIIETIKEALFDHVIKFRSSHQRCSIKIGVLKNFTKFTGSLCQSLFFNKVAGLMPAALLKKETLVEVFSSEICEIFKNTFFYRTPLDDCFCKF